ncbi:solute carrier family 23 protein [Streptomyces sp. NPDC091215]|uniref:solute carrier family 23 protein n=1 Tax=Streptomyces sp. NPDC091215 TaxID=3155192 RepID=UPI003421AD5F
MLVALALIPKLGEIVASLPGPVIGGAGPVMFATVTSVGINTLRKVEFEGTSNLLTVAVSIGVGMLPVVAPSFYHAFPTWVQIIGGSAITSATLAAFLLNLLFNHTPGGKKAEPEPVPGSAETVVPDAAPATWARRRGSGLRQRLRARAPSRRPCPSHLVLRRHPQPVGRLRQPRFKHGGTGPDSVSHRAPDQSSERPHTRGIVSP